MSSHTLKQFKRKPVNVLHSGENCYILTEMYNMWIKYVVQKKGLYNTKILKIAKIRLTGFQKVGDNWSSSTQTTRLCNDAQQYKLCIL